MAEPPSEVVSHCYRHPKREALIRCTRCDRPICPDCMRPASVGFHCPDDVAQDRKTVRAPRTSVGARLIESPPYVTISLVVLNVAAYLATGLQSPSTLSRPTRSQLFRDYVLFPPDVHAGDYERLLTAGFLHLSLLHIGANLLALGIIGPFLEAQLGPVRFLAVYLLGDLGGNAAVYAFDSRLTATAGASGAVFALFGISLVLVRRIGLDRQWLVLTIVLNFVFTFSVSNISKWGHIGGFVVGALCGLAIGGRPDRRLLVPPRVQFAGLGAVLALVVAVVAVRTAAW